MRKFYGHHDEKTENFRTFYRIVHKDVARLPTFETVANDFQGHIRYLNKEHREEEDHLTREERWKQGPDKSLPMPPLINLALFAKQVTKDTRKVQRYGFSYDSRQWEFERDDDEFRSQWVNAALNPEKREIIIMKIGRETIVLMNVSGDGRTYVRAVPKGKPRNTVQEDKALNQDARRIMEEANRADSEALEEMIRSQLAGGSLVIHSAGKKLIAKPEDPLVDGNQDTSAMSEQQDDTMASAAHVQSTGYDNAEQPPLPLDSGTVTAPLEGAGSLTAQAGDTPADGEGREQFPSETGMATAPLEGAGSLTAQAGDTPADGQAQSKKKPRTDRKTAQQSKKQPGKKGAKGKDQAEPQSQPNVTDDQDDEDDAWADFEGLAW
jgi:hypothetical protein